MRCTGSLKFLAIITAQCARDLICDLMIRDFLVHHILQVPSHYPASPRILLLSRNTSGSSKIRGDAGDKMRGNTRCPVETRSKMLHFSAMHMCVQVYYNLSHIHCFQVPFEIIPDINSKILASGSRTTPHQMKIKPNYCPPGPLSVGPLPTSQTTHQDQYLHGGQLSWLGVVRICLVQHYLCNKKLQ